MTKRNKQEHLQDECDQTKDENMKPRARYVTIIFANQTTNQINYAQPIYIQYANKYNKYKTGN